MRTRHIDELMHAVSKVYCDHTIWGDRTGALTGAAQPLVQQSYGTSIEVDAGNFADLFLIKHCVRGAASAWQDGQSADSERSITSLGGSANALSVISARPCLLENAVFRADVSDDRRTAESPLSIQAHEIPDVLVELAKSKRLSIVMGNLNCLLRDPTDQDLGRRAIRHLGFLDD